MKRRRRRVIASMICCAIGLQCGSGFAESDAHAAHHSEDTSTEQRTPDEIATRGLQLHGSYIAPITDADRATAFPELGDEAMHAHMNDDATQYFVLGDRVERQAGQDDTFLWDTTGWVGRDDDRLWLRTEGERTSEGTEQARFEALWGKPVARWWDALAGLRADFRPDPDHTWLALGIVGLAPYFFEVEATAYVASDGDTAAQVEVEYELLLTNRLIVQPHVELNFYGQDDEERGLGSGLSNIEAGLRLRYELRREFAPYVGVEWGKRFGETEDFADAEGDVVEDTRWVMGVRMWY